MSWIRWRLLLAGLKLKFHPNRRNFNSLSWVADDGPTPGQKKDEKLTPYPREIKGTSDVRFTTGVYKT